VHWSLQSTEVCALATKKKKKKRWVDVGCQTNVIKTMMLVSLMFALTMAPVSVYLLLLNIHSTLPLGGSGFYTTVVLGYLYIPSAVSACHL